MKYVVGWVLFSLWTVVIGGIGFLASFFPRSGPIVDWVHRTWGRAVFLFVGGTVPPGMGAELPAPGPFVVMSNHDGMLDIPLYLWRLPLRLRFVAKQELAFIPFLGLYMWRLGHIFVNRNDREAAIRSLNAAGAKIRGGVSVLVYPEGTRTPDPSGEMLPFKKGGFQLAIAAQVPILPCGVAGAWALKPKGQIRFSSGTLCYRIGTPIPTAGLSPDDRDALVARVRAAITDLRAQAQRDLEEYRRVARHR